MRVCILFNKVEEKDEPDKFGVKDEVSFVKETLDQLKIENFLVEIDDKSYEWIDFLKKREFDVVINLCEEFGGKGEGEGYVASFLEILKIPYTGSPPISLLICLDKILAKDIVSKNGILTPEYFFPFSFPEGSPIGYPVIIKPNKQDASKGIFKENVVYSDKDYKKILNKMKKNFKNLFAEKFIDGREFNVAIFDDKVIGIGEVLFKIEPKVVTYKAKWEKGSEEDIGTETIYPANLKGVEKRKIENLSLIIYKLLKMRDYARIDFRMDKKGKIYFIEANPNPDISKNSGFYKALNYAGIPYNFFIKKIIENALRRGNA
jgi:D-alanine-D-alanine ligase